jgi:hypothetical protein
MKTFLLMHAIYLLGALVAYLIQYYHATRVQKISFNRLDSFWAAITSFLSWGYVAYSMVYFVINKMKDPYSPAKRTINHHNRLPI